MLVFRNMRVVGKNIILLEWRSDGFFVVVEWNVDIWVLG